MGPRSSLYLILAGAVLMTAWPVRMRSTGVRSAIRMTAEPDWPSTGQSELGCPSRHLCVSSA